tara:strand:+ start:96 stop:548 length:453 start_codon:yes stop_codon:yes gene_type:complete
MSINSLISNPTILNQLANSIPQPPPTPATSSLIFQTLQQNVAQSLSTIVIDAFTVNVIGGQDYLVQVSFSASGNTDDNYLKLGCVGGVDVSEEILMVSNIRNQIYTATFKITPATTQTGYVIQLFAQVLGQGQLLITTIKDFFNIVVYTL